MAHCAVGLCRPLARAADRPGSLCFNAHRHQPAHPWMLMSRPPSRRPASSSPRRGPRRRGHGRRRALRFARQKRRKTKKKKGGRQLAGRPQKTSTEEEKRKRAERFNMEVEEPEKKDQRGRRPTACAGRCTKTAARGQRKPSKGPAARRALTSPRPKNGRKAASRLAKFDHFWPPRSCSKNKRRKMRSSRSGRKGWRASAARIWEHAGGQLLRGKACGR